MKNIHTFIFYTLIFANCTEKTNSNRPYFTIDPEDRKIVLPMQLDDSVTANLTFDTGVPYGAFFLGSAFYTSHPSIEK